MIMQSLFGAFDFRSAIFFTVKFLGVYTFIAVALFSYLAAFGVRNTNDAIGIVTRFYSKLYKF